MRAIPIYASDAEDFSTNGLGLLLPTECTIHRAGNSTYELTLIHPIADDLRWAQIQNGCILKAAAPMRESPLYELETTASGAQTATVTRKVYKVHTNGGRLHLRQKPSTSAKILSKWKPGTEVVQLKDAGSGWYQVSLVKGGETGYMYAQYLQFVRNITETVTSAKPVTQNGVRVQPAREQLFRIYSVSPDTHTGLITAKAMALAFDLRGNLINEDYKPEKTSAETAVAHAFSNQLNAHDFALHCGSLSGTVTGEYGYQSFIEALLTPETGMAAQAGALVEFDNFDIYVLPDVARDMGVTIRRRKNLIGVTVTNDDADAVTRIIPTGRNKDGDPLFLDGQIYIDSPHIGDYPTVRAKKIDYDVSVSDADDAEFKTDKAARAELRRLVQEDFDAGIDLPTYGMDVNFILLGNTAEYQHYAGLQSVHLFDTVTVIDELIGTTAKVRVTEYEWDVLRERYISATLGDIQSIEQKTYGFSLANGSVSGSKLIQGTVSGAVLRDLSVQYAKIDIATVRQLNAEAVNAITAMINSLTAGDISTNTLYAALAHVMELAADSVSAGNIETDRLAAALANISAAQITAANIGKANIQWAEIASLTAAIADIAQAQIADATITTAQISDLAAQIASVLALAAKDGRFDFASVKDLLAAAMILEEGVAGSVYIKNLVATRANFLGATLGELVLQGADGRYYRVTVQSDGEIHTEAVEVTDGEIAAGETSDGRQIVATTANVESLNASTVKAESAILSSIFTAALTAGKVSAQEAFLASATVPELRVTALKAVGDSIDLSANHQIRSMVSDIADAKSAAEDVEIGGRNLLRGTRDFDGGGWMNRESWTEDGKYQDLTVLKKDSAWDGLFQELALDAGTYTFSGWARCGAGSVIAMYIAQGVSQGAAEAEPTDLRLGDVGRDWTRVHATFEVKAAGAARVRFENESDAELRLCGLKLERGNKPTDWTPAPEDADAGISAVQDRVAAAESAVTQTQNSITALVTRTETAEVHIGELQSGLETVTGSADAALGMAEIAGDAAESARALAQAAQDAAESAKSLTQTLQTQVSQTASGLSVVRTQTSSLEGRIETIESGVHIEGSTIGIYSSDSPFQNIITESGWRITENDSPIITCAETKLTAPRVQVTDALLIGGLAWKPGNDKHLRLLKYGR